MSAESDRLEQARTRNVPWRSELVSRGLYLDMPPWGYHVFEVTSR